MNEETTEKKPAITYDGTVKSDTLCGEAKLSVEENGLICDVLFEQTAVAYADMDFISLDNYTVHITAKGKPISVSRMGQNTEWFYRELLEGYHAKVLSALHIEGQPDLVSKGRYCFDSKNGTAALQIFPDCFCILPQNRNARRIPLVFVNGLKKEDFSLSICLTSDESYTLSMLGHDLDPVEKQISGNIRKQRESNRTFIAQLNDALSFPDMSKSAGLLPEGVAAPLVSLPKPLADILEKKVKNSKMGTVYGQLKVLGDEKALAIGIKALPEETVELLKTELIEKLNANAEEPVELTKEQEDALKWIVWAALPSKDGQYVIVEFAFPDEDAATYIFRTPGDFESFLPLLNRGFEATELQREIFSLPEEKLSEDMRMLTERTPAIGKLRELYAGKAIHRGVDAWKKSILSLIKQMPAGSSKKN